MKQVHGDVLVIARNADAVAPIAHADALTTRLRGVAIAIQTADCVPVVIAGSGHVAAVHAGWRGVAKGIVPKALATLGERAGSDRDGHFVMLGPAAGRCCYEVGEEVVEAIAEVTPGGRTWIDRQGSDRPRVDLRGAILQQIVALGVDRCRVLVHSDCTICSPRRWPSYRRDGVRCGRLWVGIRRASGGSRG